MITWEGERKRGGCFMIIFVAWCVLWSQLPHYLPYHLSIAIIRCEKVMVMSSYGIGGRGWAVGHTLLLIALAYSTYGSPYSSIITAWGKMKTILSSCILSLALPVKENCNFAAYSDVHSSSLSVYFVQCIITSSISGLFMFWFSNAAAV